MSTIVTILCALAIMFAFCHVIYSAYKAGWKDGYTRSRIDQVSCHALSANEAWKNRNR